MVLYNNLVLVPYSSNMISFQGKKNELKINVATGSALARKCSERVKQREKVLASLVDKGTKTKTEKKLIKKTARNNLLKPVSNDLPPEKSTPKESLIKPPEQETNESLPVKKRCKRQTITYVIDCSCINMDTTNLVNFIRSTIELTNETFILANRLMESS